MNWLTFIFVYLDDVKAVQKLNMSTAPYYLGTHCLWEPSGSVVEGLTQDLGVVGSSLTGITALCP